MQLLQVCNVGILVSGSVLKITIQREVLRVNLWSEILLPDIEIRWKVIYSV
jgi:hypothetical protein